MTQQHPITPPPELVQQWDREWREQQNAPVIGWSANLLAYVAIRAAQWGADQELKAIIQLAGEAALPEKDRYFDGLTVAGIMAARRPKPPSLKEQALALLDPSNTYGSMTQEDEYRISVAKAEIIRRALEQLPDHENP